MGYGTTEEREVKFAVPIGLPLPDLRPQVGQTERLPASRLVTAYFDTADGRLWQQGLTLRHRTTAEDGEGLWTLKVPHRSGGRALERTEITWPGPRHAVPDEGLAVLRGLVRHEPLRRLVTLETTRQRLLIRRGSDDVAAELDDDLVRVVGGPRDGLRFRQVELELLDRRWKGRRIVRTLEGAGAHVEREAKVAKAMDLSAVPPATTAVRGLDRRSTMGDVLSSALGAGTDRLLEHDWRLRLAKEDPGIEDVHQARVATRRLRSDLKTLGGLLDPVWRRHVRQDLEWCGAVLGEVRDADVLAEGLEGAPPAIRRTLAMQRAAAARRLAEVLESDRYVNLLDRLHAGSQRLPVGAGGTTDATERAGAVLPPLVRTRWRAMRKEVRRLGPDPMPAQLHRIRIKAKQLRYAAEAAAPVVGSPARRTATAAERVQTVLGHHHDAVSAEAWLRSEWGEESVPASSPSPVPALSFEAGLLAAGVRRSRDEAERDWRRAWAELRRPKHRRWLQSSRLHKR